jgi:hypothetical protein
MIQQALGIIHVPVGDSPMEFLLELGFLTAGEIG